MGAVADAALEAGGEVFGVIPEVLVEAEAEGEARPVRAALELVGRDRPGIVREVSAALASAAVNIDELETRLEREAWSGEPLFRLKADLRAADEAGLEQARSALEAISAEIMVDIGLSRSG